MEIIKISNNKTYKVLEENKEAYLINMGWVVGDIWVLKKGYKIKW